MERGPGDRDVQGGSGRLTIEARRCTETLCEDSEVALCRVALVFLRSLRLTSDFFLVSNTALGDVVLLYRPRGDQSLRYRAILLQANHREKLKDCLDSFREVENLCREPVNVEGQTIEFEEISLVLYTNTGCVTGDAVCDVTDSPDAEHLRDILDTGGRLLRISDPGLPGTSDFTSSHLVLCAGQTSVAATDQLLEEEICRMLRLTSLADAKDLVQKLKRVVRSWWREEGEGRSLSARCEEWKRVVELQVARLNSLQSQLNLDFTAAALEELRSLAAHKQSWISVRDEDQGTATRARLLKALRTCLVLDAASEALESRLAEVEALWGTDACPCLALDVSAGSHPQLLQRLLKALGGTRSLVVVARGEPPAADWTVLEAEGTWSILDVATQQRLLAAQVDLQGEVVPLRDVIGSAAAPVMSDKFIRSLCGAPAEGVVQLGARISPPLEYYVPRCMQRTSSKTIDFKTLANTDTLLFPDDVCDVPFIHAHCSRILYPQNLDTVDHVTGAVLLGEECPQVAIRRICCKFGVRGIGGDFGPEDGETTITEFVPLTWLCEEKVIVLEGPPGIGKSSFVTAMCSRVKERFPASWVLRIDMGKLSEFIDERDFRETSDVTEFLLRGLRGQYEEQELLQHALYVTGHVFLFLDAFDEVSPDFTAKCCQLLKGIASWVRCRQMVVTTRPVTSKVVQEALGTKAFNLPVFGEDEQRLFLERFCMNVGEEEFSSVRHTAGAVSTIPRLLKIAAEVLLRRDGDQMLLKYENPWRRVLLYQLLVEQNLSNRLQDKFGQEVPGGMTLLESSAVQHSQNLQALAARKLMPASVGVSDGLPDEKLGLVVDTGGSVEFEHETFAEFFLGRWLACHWRQCPPQLLREVLVSKVLVAATLSWSLLEGLPLHEAVAQGDEAQVRALLSSGLGAADRDGGGRSALHVAAITQGARHQVVGLLLAAGQDPNSGDDDILGCSAVMHAEMFRNWEFLDVLLQKGMPLEGLTCLTDLDAAKELLVAAVKLSLSSLFLFALRLHQGLAHQRLDDKGTTLLHLAAACNNTAVVTVLTEDMRHDVNVQDDDASTPLHGASDLGHLEAVKLLLEAGADPNIRDGDEQTTLMLAAFRGHLEVVKLLLGNGADPNVEDDNGVTAVIRAACQNHLEVVKVLLEAGADTGVVYGNSLLTFAALQGQVETVKLLMERRTLNAEEGVKALTCAAGQGHAEVVKLLLENGADPNIKNEDDQTSLMLAAFKGHKETARMLTDNGAAPDIKRENGETSLMMAAFKGHLEIVKLLLDTGADPDVKNRDGETSLMVAAFKGYTEIVKLLLEVGVDPDVKRQDGLTALMMGICQGQLGVVRMLMDVGADPNIRNDVGVTALMLAAVQGHQEIVKLLVENGADLDVKDDAGVTALMQAADRGHLGVVKLLTDTGADPNIKKQDGETALMVAVFKGHLEVVKLLLGVGADPDIQNDGGVTALMVAVVQDHRELVKLLVENGVDLNLKKKNGLTALMLAICQGRFEVVRMLLETGADPNMRNEDGVTALMLAVGQGHQEAVEVLLENGADPDIKDDDGVTALMLAADHGHQQLVKLLIATGADPNVKKQDGETSLMLAADQGHQEVVKLLVENGADPDLESENGLTAVMLASGQAHVAIMNYLLDNDDDG